MVDRKARGFSLLEVALAVSIGMIVVAAGLWQYKQQAQDSRIAQSKMMLQMIRSGLTKYRYLYGVLPTRPELWKNFAVPPGAAAGVLIVEVPSSSFIPPTVGADLWASNNGVLYEPISGLATIRRLYDANTNPSAGGWIYDDQNGQLASVSVDLSSASVAGEVPTNW